MDITLDIIIISFNISLIFFIGLQKSDDRNPNAEFVVLILILNIYKSKITNINHLCPISCRTYTVWTTYSASDSTVGFSDEYISVLHMYICKIETN